MTEPKKYKLAYGIEEVNTLNDLGYKVHSFETCPVEGGFNERAYLMSLSSEKAYDNITNLVDIPPDMVDGYLAKGWIIADSWSKTIRMVKKNV